MTVHCRSGECVSKFGCYCGCADCREMQDAEDAPEIPEIQNAEKENENQGHEVPVL